MAEHLKQLHIKKQVTFVYAQGPPDSDGKRPDRVRGVIQSDGSIKIGDEKKGMSPTAFAKDHAKIKVHAAGLCKVLFVELDGDDVCVADAMASLSLSGLDEGLGPIRQSIRDVLSDLGIESIDALYAACQNEVPLPARLFRVVRLKEIETLKTHGLMARAPAPSSLEDFCMGVYNHVAHGSRSATSSSGRCFISTTWDVSCAAWWSSAFVQPVVVLSAADHIGRSWDPTNEVFQRMYEKNKFYVNTATKSREFIVEHAEAQAVLQYRPRRDVKRVAQFPEPESFEFPASFEDLAYVTNLGGCSEVAQVRDIATGRVYAMKRGAQSTLLTGLAKLSTCASHVIAEFFAFALYHLCGAPTPAAALYRVRVTDSDGVDLSMWVLLTEFIAGRTLSLDFVDSVDNAREWAWLDLALANFDVAGINFANLVCRPHESVVYRIDCGCNIAFAADGKSTRFYPLDEAELDAFKDPNSKRSIELSSKCNSTGTRKPKSSGSARSELMSPACTLRALSVRMQDLDFVQLRRTVDDWLWQQPEPQAVWSDMADATFSRAEALRHFARAAPIQD
jgi:hypothetical protein